MKTTDEFLFPRFFLIDAHALCYRAFFAIKGLATSKGQATNAVYGFVATLRKILREYEPRYMGVCFDVKGKTRRQERYAEYKIQRPVMPDDLISQIPLIKDVVAAYRLPILESEGYEADDVIATVVKKMHRDGIETVIVSDDKDMLQLVGPGVKVFNSRQDKILGPEEIKSLLGFDPAHIPDFIALAGDTVDNIPGVKGIGEVSAKNLILEYGNLEAIFDNIAVVKPERLRGILTEQKDMAFLSKELALLEQDVPLLLDLEQLRVKPPDEQRLLELFNDLEFRRLAAEFAPSGAAWQPNVAVDALRGDSEVRALADQIESQGTFSFLADCPAGAGDIAVENRIFVALKDRICQIPASLWGSLKDVFANPKIAKVTYDLKEQHKRLSGSGIFLNGNIFDAMLAGYLLAPSRGNHSMPVLAWEYLKKTVVETEGPARVVPVLAELYEPLLLELRAKDLEKLFRDIEIPLALVLSRMETEGVCLDVALLENLSREAGKRIDALVKDLYRLAGEEFNLNSPKQLSVVLFQKLKLPVVKKTKTGFSTDEGVLVKLAEAHELPAKLLEYRQLAKLKSTYIDALPKLVDPQTGRIHASFNQVGTETGRLSSNNPNLQNIPIRAELGREIRRAFIPSRKENFIIAADYSQIELRILAHLSQDKNLLEAFKKNEDIHAFTAARIFDVAEDQVTLDMRNSAKRVNFGIIYGMSAFGLAKDLGISQPQAQDFIDRYFLRYPEVKVFMDSEISKCRKLGYVTTLLNRRRYIPEINSGNMAIRQFAERQAINTPVQGSAADLIKLAMINVAAELEKQKLASRMIITVHDELVFDVVPAEERMMTTLIREDMEHPMSLTVPIQVSLKKGKNWLEMEKL